MYLRDVFCHLNKFNAVDLCRCFVQICSFALRNMTDIQNEADSWNSFVQKGDTKMFPTLKKY